MLEYAATTGEPRRFVTIFSFLRTLNVLKSARGSEEAAAVVVLMARDTADAHKRLGQMTMISDSDVRLARVCKVATGPAPPRRPGALPNPSTSPGRGPPPAFTRANRFAMIKNNDKIIIIIIIIKNLNHNSNDK